MSVINEHQKLSAWYWKKKIERKEKVQRTDTSERTFEELSIHTTDLAYFNKLTNNNKLAGYTILSSVYSILLRHFLYDYDGYILCSSPSPEQPKASRSLLLHYPVDLSDTFKTYLSNAKQEMQSALQHADQLTVIHDMLGIDGFTAFSNYSIHFHSRGPTLCNGLALHIQFDEEALVISGSHLNDFIKPAVVQQLVKNFGRFLQNMESLLNVPLSSYSLLSPEERTLLLTTFNTTRVSFPEHKSIIELFEEQVEKDPHRPAIRHGAGCLSYHELNCKANQLAHHIRSRRSFAPETVIGVLLPKSDQAILSFLAILKLGGTYLPIDTRYPAERIRYIIENSELQLLIHNQDPLSFTSCEQLNIQEMNCLGLPTENLRDKPSSRSVAYMIYTSGSTGTPKGVMIEHRSNVNMSLSLIRTFGITPADHIVWFSSIAFDASISEIMMALHSGACLCIPEQGVIEDKTRFISYLKDCEASVVIFPPSYLNQLQAEELTGLRCLITAGEEANPGKANEVMQQGIAYFNAYGPTEYAVCATIYKGIPFTEKPLRLPIGRPISNTCAYILNDYLQPLPIGVTGKLYLSGAGIARGYKNKADLTTAKFIAHPFVPGERLYDTGDMAAWLTDGSIDFLGRSDHQVKLRGFRIETEEIAHCISRYSSDIQQTVVTTGEMNGNTVLIAYWVSKKAIDKSKLREFLSSQLPEYMVPSFFIPLHQFPVTVNGKIDRQKLPGIQDQDRMRKAYIAPATATEKKLAKIWEEILGIEKIGIHDDFFELGGNSLMIGQIINRAYKQLGIQITFKSFFSGPTIHQLSNAFTPEKFYRAIEKAEKQLSYAVTPSQSRLWILSQLDGGNIAYNMPAAVKLLGEMNVPKFSASFQQLIQRHEILRTGFKIADDGELKQYIVPSAKVTFKIAEVDLSNASPEELERYLISQNADPFDLSVAPLIKASLIRLKVSEYIFFLSLHHIIGDGWSTEILIEEVIKMYNALLQDKKARLPRLSIQYKDYAAWLNTQLKTDEKYRAAEKYWMQQLSGELPALVLPGSHARPVVQTYKGDHIRHLFSPDFSNKLKTFAQEQRLTLFTVLNAGISILLHNYSGQDDIIIGTPVAGREHPNLENQLGLYLNTLALRMRFEEEDRFSDILSRQKETLSDAYEHQHYPFDLLVNQLNLKRDSSRSAIFDVMIILQNQSQLKTIHHHQLEALEIFPFEFNSKTSQFDITFIFSELDSGLQLNIQYNTDLYDRFLIERIFGHFENLLLQMLDNPGKQASQAIYTTAAERKLVLEEFNHTKVEHPANKTLTDLFEEQVQRSPSATAVVYEHILLTYRELNEKANRLASYLRGNYDIQPDRFIGIQLERSEQMIIAMLGVMKSGAAYVPLDPSYPPERLQFIEKDSNCMLIVNASVLNEIDSRKDSYSAANPPRIHQPHDLAYLIYTSGTTGYPKGVMIEHRNAVELIHWSQREFDPSTFEVMYALTSFCFDLSVYEIFYPLSIGKKIRVLKNPFELKTYLPADQRILLNTVPSVVRNLLEEGVDLHNVTLINLAGEVLPVDLVRRIRSLYAAQIRNLYGPSEDTTYSTCYTISNKEYKTIPVGKPVSNTQVYILNPQLLPQPVGVPGKLYISGAGVSRGYLNREELSATRFIPDPFRKGQLMYDTGDLAFWLPDGNIEFMGRTDFQVKVRGHRIELNEIENCIAAYSSDIGQVVVDAKDSQGEQVLVAYFTATTAIEKSALRTYLLEKIPRYMVPNFYHQLQRMPLSQNGKIDRKALPAISGEDRIRKTYVAPCNETEETLAKIWQEALGVKEISVTDDFFELGGHSLSAMVVMNKVNRQFQTDISLSEFFSNKNIRSIASIILEKEWLHAEVNLKNEIIL
jgi:amino acid adenylation domain-containing protein